MGYSLSWLAVRGKPVDVVLGQLGLRGTGTREEIPESPIVGAELPGGWYLVLSNKDVQFLDDNVLSKMSAGCEVVTCFVEEHVMYSEAKGWEGGKAKWSVTHDAEKGLDHLQPTGEVPAAFGPIHERLRAELETAGENAVDFLFDVPAELAKVQTGFRHDEDCPGATGDPFEVLTSASASTSGLKRSWIRKLLG